MTTSGQGLSLSLGSASGQIGPRVLYRVIKTSLLFEQVAQQVEGLIRGGVFQVGDRLPAERDLARLCGVSRNVVRHAVKKLSQRGLVETHSGQGTFVIEHDASPLAAGPVDR